MSNRVVFVFSLGASKFVMNDFLVSEEYFLKLSVLICV